MEPPEGTLSHEATVEALGSELELAVELAGEVDPGLDVPTTPGWSAGQLLEHLGGVHRWAAALLEQRSTRRIPRRELGIEPPSAEALGPWLAEGAEKLGEAVRSTPPQTPVWTWGDGGDARWWTRRMLHETVVHTADLLMATGSRPAISAAVAADGISELLDNTPSRLSWPDATRPDRDATVHLHATDDADPAATGGDGVPWGEWLVEMAGGEVRYTRAHGKGDTAVRGPASELVLVMNRRLPVERAEVDLFGGTSPLEMLLVAVGH